MAEVNSFKRVNNFLPKIIYIIYIIKGRLVMSKNNLKNPKAPNQKVSEDYLKGIKTITKTKEEYEEAKIIVPFTRTLDYANDRRLPYRSRANDYKYTIHLGQRKLLMSEIEFLSFCVHKDPKGYSSGKYSIVYAGSAAGTHIKLLAINFFPKFKYYLYDPAKFDPILTGINNIKTFNEYFTDDTSRDVKKLGKVIFISDIRRTPSVDDDDPSYEKLFESMVVEDMAMQMGWVKIIQPEMTMLKFRLPYSPGKTKYFAGKILYQVWPGETSTEGRLVLTKKDLTKTIILDNDEYQNIFYRHNLLTRIQPFKLISHDLNAEITTKEIKRFPGLDFDYDSRAEIDIVSTWQYVFGIRSTIDNLAKIYYTINKVVKRPSFEVHGQFPYVPMGYKKMMMIQKVLPFQEKDTRIKQKKKRLKGKK